MESPETNIFLSLKPDGSKGATQVWKLVCSDMWCTRDDGEHWPGQREDIWKLRPFILGWAPKRALKPNVNLRRRNERTNTLELQQKTKKKIQGLSLLFLLMAYCFSLSSWRRWLSFHALFLSSHDYFKSVVANKILCLWTKTEVCVFLTFFHAMVTAGTDYDSKHSNTCINVLFRTVALQRSIWYSSVTTFSLVQ